MKIKKFESGLYWYQTHNIAGAPRKHGSLIARVVTEDGLSRLLFISFKRPIPYVGLTNDKHPYMRDNDWSIKTPEYFKHPYNQHNKNYLPELKLFLSKLIFDHYLPHTRNFVYSDPKVTKDLDYLIRKFK